MDQMFPKIMEMGERILSAVFKVFLKGQAPSEWCLEEGR